MRPDSEAIFDRLEIITLALLESITLGGTEETPLLLAERDELLGHLAIAVDTPFFEARMARVRADDAALVRAANVAYGEIQATLTQGHRDRRSAQKYRSGQAYSRIEQTG